MPTLRNVGKKSSLRFLMQKFFGILSAGISAVSAAPTALYDNSKFPPFEMNVPSRGFQNVSIHPNGEEWLITEIEKNKSVRSKSHILLYNLKTKRLQRYELPGNYYYPFATFSRNGEYIVIIRRELLPGQQIEDRLAELKTSEIAIMKKNGRQFRVLPAPRGIIGLLTTSPDDKKIAYWIAGTVRQPGSKTYVADFDIREFDLTTQTDKLFAGPFKFFAADSINYLSDSTLIVGAYVPRMDSEKVWEYTQKFNHSEIYFIERGQSEVPDPSFAKRDHPRKPTIDNAKNIYINDFPQAIGRALTRISSDGKSTSWRAPDMDRNDICQITASPTGDYLSFIYGKKSARSHESEFALGIFETKTESWKTIFLPSLDEATSIPVVSDN